MITDIWCIDKKRHNWQIVSIEHGDYAFSLTSYVSWCKRCGSITEFTQEYRKSKKRCYGGKEQKYYIKIPNHFKQQG